ncbi:MAG TPA: general stress protein [Kineosporiaceae bacterium]
MPTPDAPMHFQAADSTRWTVVVRYDNYAAAQKAVDHLSDEGFPVSALSIVSSGLRLVEKITGRRTMAATLATGATDGATTGLWIGLLLALFTNRDSFATAVMYGVLLGAAGGTLTALISHWAARGQRDFTSVPFVAGQYYEVVATDARANQARIILGHAGLLATGNGS